MKKRIVSMLLALTLVVSGMPVGITADGVNAAEFLVSEALTRAEETEDAEETESAVENNDAYEVELRHETDDLYAFNVSGDGKAVGSDGVKYEDVVYLSADTVKSLGAEGQSTYVEICNQIAAEKNAGDYLQNAVIAVDEDGNLIFNYSVSMAALRISAEKLAENVLEEADVTQGNEAEDDVAQADEKAEELSTQENEEEIVVDEDSDKENASNEINAEEVEEASKAETTVEDDPVKDEEPSTEESITDDAKTDDVLTDDASVGDEELSTEEVMADDDNAAEEETKAATEEFVLTAENMELIYEPEVEEFEIVENAKADIVIDLGYNNVREMQQFYVIQPDSESNYFGKQLTTEEKKIYDACSKVLGKGTNTFSFTGSKVPDAYYFVNIDRAIAAYVLTEPYKTDWIDWTKDYTGTNYYLLDGGRKIYQNTSITLPKSKYYTSAKQKAANAKVLELAQKAQEYAAEESPDSPVYGIVKYFDKWICENNVYDMRGVYGGASTDKNIQEAYYNCHSSYGILLEGYGVCESYALAMTRLLDSVGIPNMYATGQALDENGSYIYDANGYLAGGHAWNYIGMPDGKWYLQDSTWNDVGAKSDETYLLCADDTSQPNGRIPDGNRWSGLNAFEFVPRSSSKYDYEHSTEKFTLSKNEINLLPKKSEELTYSNTYISNENVPKVWASSNEKVAKVDKNGKVTAVAPGSAEITLTAAGMTAKCTVNVHQINSIMFEEGGKASLTTSCGIVDGSTPEIQHIYLTVNQKAENPKYTAEELKDVFGDFGAKSSKTDIATVSASLTGNTIDLAIQPVAKGKTTITVTLGTKKATLNFSVSEKLDEKWFNLPDFKANVDYTGKAYKPKVELTQLGKDKKVKYKVTYKNNKDAGDASVVITGTGTFGGELKYDFTINPLVLKVDLDTIKVTDKPVLYNGGANLTKSTVKHIDESGKKPKKVGLKAGKDYEIRYTNKDTKVTTAEPTVVGEYTMAIVGKGNYAGGANTPVPIRDADGNDKIWTIEKTDFKKVKVNVKVTGTTVAVTVAIGKNVLPATDYTMGFYKDKNCTESVSPTSFAAKTQYYIKVVPKGSNINSEDDKNNKPIVKNFKTK